MTEKKVKSKTGKRENEEEGLTRKLKARDKEKTGRKEKIANN